ncbi:hypothetical protein [Micromonospora zhanjiangensis]|uniref:Ring hydroxylating alpha subunit (Catalytic domain) n=1 Tax=Micromonospora zhanjiangensis TaxID=1522057 RepID=A0ABV8KV10_9ACTN
MRSGRLVNAWSSYDSEEVCWWEAIFPFELGPDFLSSWQDVVLATANDTDILRIEKIDRIDYSREVDGRLVDFLHNHPESVPESGDEWRPAGFALNYIETFPDRGSKTRLTYADRKGEPADAWVDNMHEFAYPLGLARSFPNPPFSIDYVISDSYDPDFPSHVGTIFSVSTDIWFPWTSGFSHESGLMDEVLDNRGLAAINGPRLNTFLHQMHDETARIGGSWTARGGLKQLQAQLNEKGIDLSAPRPTL